MKFKVGDKVYKPKGYKFPGIVVAVFQTTPIFRCLWWDTYVPDKDKPSTWKLRIDDATHVRSAVAALGKGFRGNKVEIPADEKDSVIRKVRKAYKKFYPEIVSEEGYPKALELK
jgi:hypothetical protein